MNFNKDRNQHYKYKFCKYLFRREKLLGNLQEDEDIFSDTSSEGCHDNNDIIPETASSDCNIDDCIETILLDSSSDEDDQDVLDMLMSMLRGDLHPSEENYSLEYITNIPDEIGTAKE